LVGRGEGVHWPDLDEDISVAGLLAGRSSGETQSSPMRRVAIFGNAGGGKSTLARRLAAMTGLPLHVVDKIQFEAGGNAVPHEEYLRAHARLLETSEWIIDGFGDVPSA
jgi:hypothetical protein